MTLYITLPQLFRCDEDVREDIAWYTVKGLWKKAVDKKQYKYKEHDYFEKKAKRCLTMVKAFAKFSTKRQAMMMVMAGQKVEKKKKSKRMEISSRLVGDKKEDEEYTDLQEMILKLIKEEQKRDMDVFKFLVDPQHNVKRRIFINYYYSNPDK